MAEGLKINLGVLEEVAKKCEEDGHVSEMTDYAQQKVNKIQRKVMLMRGKTYKQFHELLSDLDDDLRGLKNNIEEVSEDIEKYVEKMDDATPINIDNEIFIAADFNTIKKKINNVKENTQTYATGLVNSQLSEPIPTTSLEELLDTEDDTPEKRREIYDAYKEEITSLLELNNCFDYIQDVKDNTKKILDFYDQDYDMSDHLRDIGSFGANVVEGIVVGAIAVVVAETIGIVGVSSVVIAIGLEAEYSSKKAFYLTFKEDYSSGETVIDSWLDAKKQSNINWFVTVGTGGISNQVELKGLGSKNIDNSLTKISSKVDYDLKAVLKNTDSNPTKLENIDGKLNKKFGEELSLENLAKSVVTTPVGKEIGKGMYEADLSEIFTDYPEEETLNISVWYTINEDGEVKIEKLEEYDI